MTQNEIDEGKLRVEQGKLEVEQGKLKVEQGKLKVAQETLALEQRKHESQTGLQYKTLISTAGSVLISTIVAVAGLLYNAHLQRDLERQKAADDFKLKAAEIVMNSSGPAATKDRADAMHKLFPDDVSDKFAEDIQPPPPPEEKNPELVGDPETKDALIRLLTEHPDRRERIIKDYSAVFPDKWIKCLQTPNPCPSR